MMTNKELVTAVKKIANSYSTLYVMGCFGAPLVTRPFDNIKRYTTNHSYNKKAARTKMIKAAADKKPVVYGFDCVNLIKAVLWGWDGDEKKSYGGAVYGSNGVPDVNADTMFSKCKDASTDFSNIEVGEALWMPGHIGIYIGNGLAVESTPAWENCVQVTAVKNIGTKAGYKARAWKKHGKLPYVMYINGAKKKKDVTEIAQEVLDGKWGNGDVRKNKITAAGYDYAEVQLEVNKLLSDKGKSKKKTNREIAKEVLAGKWGNGTTRKLRLKAAGYDYEAVQKEVNKLVN